LKGIWKYSHLLPQVEESCKLTLGEGGTPLVRSKRLGPAMGLNNLYFKLEMLNPSGSYKDRFAAVAVSDLLQNKKKFCLATSSGNTGAALAAFSAAADIKCFLMVVDGAPTGKMKQMQVYGCQTLMVRGFGKDVEISKDIMFKLKELAESHQTIIQISAYVYSPVGMAGVQTIAYEIAEDLHNKADHVFSPAGGGGLTLALAKGFNVWKDQIPDFKIPRLHCVQPEGNDTISGPLRIGLSAALEITRSTTLVSGLQVPNILDGNEVISMCKSTKGTGYTVSDQLIYQCQEELAKEEGIFCEPAGAVALAGLKLALENREINTNDHIICIVTGHGFKDPVSADKIAADTTDNYFTDNNVCFSYINSQINTLL
jgi:threonine synthase